MGKRIKQVFIAGCILNLLVSTAVLAETFSFGLWGDMPYTRNNDGSKSGEKMTRLLDSINASELAFTVFDGDTKDGSSICTDNVIGLETITLFNKTKAPTIYVPGDNEWTDCHRINNGGYNNLERLDFLRRTMFTDDYSFGQTTLKLQRQGPARGLYSENSRWLHGGIVFIGLNVPGSNNNKVFADHCISKLSARSHADCDADNAEYLARDAANIAYLRESFQIARQNNAPGLVLVIHADLGFDLPETPEVNERNLNGFDGYNTFLAILAQETRAFVGQVLLVHGDTHFYKIDKPLIDQAHLIKNFTRLETFGSPNLHWVKVSVDTNSPNVFSFQPVLVPGN